MSNELGAAPLMATLREPQRAADLSLAAWSDLIAVARSANLLGRLAKSLHDAGVEPAAPAKRHLDAALQLSTRQRQSVMWEAHELSRALSPLGVPVVLLKGAAYTLGNHPVGEGRLFGDIDILVPRDALGKTEMRLMVAGWTSAKTSDYDQRYYRKWMHELPPMMHVRRGTVLDVHHTILPLTARHSPDPRHIMETTEPLAGLPCLHIPAEEYLLIHSITHLLHEGELHNGLRDLFDIDGLIREGAAQGEFWARVVDASGRMGLSAYVYFGLQLARTLIGSPIPAAVLEALQAAAPRRWHSPLLEALYRAALRPECEAANSASATVARFAIYVRAHWLRMPPHLLVRHLARKGLQRLDKKEPALAGRA